MDDLKLDAGQEIDFENGKWPDYFITRCEKRRRIFLALQIQGTAGMSLPDLLEVPIGFQEGVSFEKKSLSKLIGSVGSKEVSVLHISDLLTQADDIDLGLEDALEKPEGSENDVS